MAMVYPPMNEAAYRILTEGTPTAEADGTACATGNAMQIGPADTLSLLTSLNPSGSGASVGGFPITGTDGNSAPSFGPDALPDLTGAGNAITGTLSAAYGQSLNPTTPTQSPKAAKAEKVAIASAQAALDENRVDDARDILSGVLQKNRQSTAAFATLGEVELKAGDYGRAEQYFQRADSLAPDVGYDRRAEDARVLQSDDESVYARAQQKLRAPDTRDDGIRLLAALTARSPTNVEARVALAEGLLSSGNATGSLLQYQLAIGGADQSQLAKIETRLTELTETAPKAVFLRKLVAESQLGQGKFREARQTLDVAAQNTDDPSTLNVDRARGAVGLGRQSLAAGDVTSALDKFQTAASLDRDADYVRAALADGYVARGEQRARLGQRSSAVEDFRLASRYVSSNDAELRDRAARGAFAVGAALKRRREDDESSPSKEVVALQAAYDIDPSNLTYRRELADSRNALGAEFAADGKLKDAAYAYQRAHKLERTNTTYRANATNAFYAYGDDRVNHSDFTAAIDAYRQAFNIDNQSTASKQKLATGYDARGRQYVAQGKFDLALKDFREAVKYDPTNTSFRDNLHSVGG